MSELSIRIQSIRQSQEITQAELAARIGMLPAQLCRIETGRTDPSFSTAVRIADALGITISELLASEVREDCALSQMTSSQKGACGPVDMQSSGDLLLVREVSRPAEKAARKAIKSREGCYDEIDRRYGAGTRLPLSHPFIWEKGGAETLSRVMRAALGAGEMTFADLPGLLDLNGVRIHFVSFRGGEPSVSFFEPAHGTLSIAVQKDDTPERQTYRLAYELGAACLFVSAGRKTLRDKDADHRILRRFAAAFLMPEDGVRKVVAQCGLTRSSWSMSALLALKVRFNVSAEAFALRLEELGLIQPTLRNRFRDELRAHYAAHPKAMEPAPCLPPLRDSMRLEVGKMVVYPNKDKLAR